MNAKSKHLAEGSWKYNKGKLAFFACVLFLSFICLVTLPRLSLPLILSYIIVLVLKPFPPLLTRFGIGKNVSYVLVLLLFATLAVLPIINVVPKLQVEADRVQNYIPKVEVFVVEKFSSLQLYLKDKVGMELGSEHLGNVIGIARNSIKDVLLGIPNYLATFLEWLFIVPLFVFFMLKDGSKFKRLVLKMVPNTIFERTYAVFHQFNKKLGDYIFAKGVEASIVGLIITIGLLIIDVRFAFLLGFLAAITNIVPYVGPLLGMAPGIIVALVDYGFSPNFVAVAILYTVANVIDLALVFPILVSKIVDLHPLIVVISVILGSQYMGIMGMIISIPLAAIIKLIVLEIYRAIYPENSRHS